MKKPIINSLILLFSFTFSVSGMKPDSTSSHSNDKSIDTTGVYLTTTEWGKSVPENQSIKFPYENNDKFFNSTLSKILVGSAVVLGGVSAYFKLKADKEFENHSNNNNYESNYNTYDTISGVSLGLLQVNIGILIYYFLSD
ncbi:MAG: hypothetical protein M0P71_06935 [Melioribacteraceae bacterium]|nr:hypothetical protein [Melioribacteraceae bacterium]